MAGGSREGGWFLFYSCQEGDFGILTDLDLRTANAVFCASKKFEDAVRSGFSVLSSLGVDRCCPAVGLWQRVSGNSNLLPGMSRLMDEHRIGYFGDLAESGCRGPSILNTAFLADA